jgi:hypothetical protein
MTPRRPQVADLRDKDPPVNRTPPATATYHGVVRKFRSDYMAPLASGVMLVLEVKGDETPRDKTRRRFLAEWIKAENQHGDSGAGVRMSLMIQRRLGRFSHCTIVIEFLLVRVSPVSLAFGFVGTGLSWMNVAHAKSCS